LYPLKSEPVTSDTAAGDTTVDTPSIARATLEHAFEIAIGRLRRGSLAGTLSCRSPAAAPRHPGRLVAVRLHTRRARPPHLHLPLPRQRLRVRSSAQLPTVPWSDRGTCVMGV